MRLSCTTTWRWTFTISEVRTVATRKVKFDDLEVGQEFMSVSGAFIKTSERYAKRTERHWADSDKAWFFTYASQVYIKAEPDSRGETK